MRAITKDTSTISQWIFEILPQPIYHTLSDNYHLILQYTYRLRMHSDPSTMKAIQLGLTIGVILVTFLSFFPGEISI